MTTQTQDNTQKVGKNSIINFLLNVVFLAGLWWVITNGAAASWLIGLPALACAAWVNRYLSGSSSPRISFIGLARFLPFFIWQSLRGGIDVVLRTVALRMRIYPGFTRYRTGLTSLSARTFFTYCVSLLPGTLAADLQDQWVEVHVLNSRSNPTPDLARLERVVMRLFVDGGDVR
jgi:multicomponent Na+:H+ antiporter subunit E